MEVTWSLPTRIFTLPAAHISDSQIFWEQAPLGQSGSAECDQKPLTYYTRIETVGTAACANSDQSDDSITDIAPHTRGFWTEREPAFALIGSLAHDEAPGNAAYPGRVKERVALLHKMQVDNGNRAWVHNLYDHDPSEGCAPSCWGSSPRMSGLLLEAIIKYHKLTDDPIARPPLPALVDRRSQKSSKRHLQVRRRRQQVRPRRPIASVMLC